jgi:hypothetical protein
VLLPVDSGPITTIFLIIIFFVPVQVNDKTNNKKNEHTKAQPFSETVLGWPGKNHQGEYQYQASLNEQP